MKKVVTGAIMMMTIAAAATIPPADASTLARMRRCAELSQVFKPGGIIVVRANPRKAGTRGRHMSASVKKRLSPLAKQRWAERQKQRVNRLG